MAMTSDMAERFKDDRSLSIEDWLQGFVDDLAVVRSAATVRAYAADVKRWISFCQHADIHPFRAGPRTAIDFIRSERQRSHRSERTVGPRTIVRRLSAIRQWYAYLALQPDETGVHRNPIPSGSAARTGAGLIYGRPALLRFDEKLPQALSADEVERFLHHLAVTHYRDQAIVRLLMDGGLRTNEVLQLRTADVGWSKRVLTVR